MYCTNLAKPSGRWYWMYRKRRLLAASCGVGCKNGTSSATTSGGASAGAGGRGTGLCTVSASAWTPVNQALLCTVWSTQDVVSATAQHDSSILQVPDLLHAGGCTR